MCVRVGGGAVGKALVETIVCVVRIRWLFDHVLGAVRITTATRANLNCYKDKNRNVVPWCRIVVQKEVGTK